MHFGVCNSHDIYDFLRKEFVLHQAEKGGCIFQRICLLQYEGHVGDSVQVFSDRVFGEGKQNCLPFKMGSAWSYIIL